MRFYWKQQLTKWSNKSSRLTKAEVGIDPFVMVTVLQKITLLHTLFQTCVEPKLDFQFEFSCYIVELNKVLFKLQFKLN